ncbi:MAG: T9SS type A sorting domain-containing protein [Ignavibacteriales bacterium]|nr:T9SS type A sorting domain-containing protein [Ignavibacteriales bacterium]
MLTHKFIFLFFITIELSSQAITPFTINTYTNGDQNNHSFSILNNDNIFSIWQSYGQNGSQNGNDIYACIYNQNGIKIKNEFQISDSISYNNITPKCTKLSNGNILVCWTRGEYGISSITGKIIAKIFSSNGSLIKDEFIINDSSNGLSKYILEANNAIPLGLTNGNYAIAHSYWGDNDSVRVVIFNSTHQIIKSFKFYSPSSSVDKKIRLAELSNNIIIVYEKYDQNDIGIFYRIINATNLTISNEMQANIEYFDYQEKPDIIVLSNGTFVISWRKNYSDSSFTYCRIFNSIGIPITNELKSKYEIGSFITAKLVQNKNNNFYMIYGNRDTWKEKLIYAKEFNFYGEITYEDFNIFSFNKVFYDYEIKPYNDNFLYLAFESSDNSSFGLFGVFLSSYPTSIKSFVDYPIHYNLYQNYPNPFNPSTTIKFDLPFESIVKLQIFNTLGQIIDTPIDEQSYAGRYQLKWNASDISSGIYFYRFVATSVEDNSKQYTKTIKMILMK